MTNNYYLITITYADVDGIDVNVEYVDNDASGDIILEDQFIGITIDELVEKLTDRYGEDDEFSVTNNTVDYVSIAGSLDKENKDRQYIEKSLIEAASDWDSRKVDA